MKAIDYLIIALIVACMFVGYSGHRVIAILLMTLVVILASWRFWDNKREKELQRTGCSSEMNPERDDWADLHSDDDPSGEGPH